MLDNFAFALQYNKERMFITIYDNYRVVQKNEANLHFCEYLENYQR